MTRLGLAVGLALGLAGCAGPPTSEGLFQDPVAIAATPDGTLWVVDAGSAEVLAIRDGVVVRRIGGSGTGDDAFLDPVDVDPTNGQTIFVADRAAGAIVRVTAEGRIAQSIPVPDLDPAQPSRQPRRGETRGQPIAVAAAPDGGLYVIDGGRRHVLKLDAQGSVERVLGAGLLSNPIDLAVADDGSIWVGDSGRSLVQRFSPFGAAGGVTRVYETGGPIVGIAVLGQRLVVAQSRTLVRGVGFLAQPRLEGEPDLRGLALLPNGDAVWLTADGTETGPTHLE